MKKSFLIVAITSGLLSYGSVYAGTHQKAEQAESYSIHAKQLREKRSLNSQHNKLASAKQQSFSRSNQAKTKQAANGAIELRENQAGSVTLSRRQQAKQPRVQLEQKSNNVVLRDKTPQKSSNAFGFSFYSATSILDLDLDNDGYFSDFTLSFDADFDGGSADVYAVIYYSRNNSDWTELAETEVFNIYLDNASDEYSLSTTLNFGFPTGDYDFLIDLYEAGVSGIVATISSDQVDSLYALPLEDREHEVVNNTSQISFVATDLFGDQDGDAFYTDLTLEYDIDAQYSGDIVYAEVILKNIAAGWQQRLTSSDFELSNSTEFVDLTFNNGYPPGYYDVTISLINAFTGEVIADAGREFSSLNDLPIESVNYDDLYDDLTPDVDIRVSGGGSLGFIMLLLVGLGFGARLRATAKAKAKV